jgi:4-hydroxy-tetrahydrodipicolinate reductase
MIRVAVVGASGRTGQRVVATVLEHEELELVAALTHRGSSALGMDAGSLCGLEPCGVRISPLEDTSLEAVKVIIDFSLPQGLSTLLKRLGTQALVTGTTGLEATEERALRHQAQRAPVLTAANFSTGLAVLKHLVSKAASTLPDYDIEIIEAHHRFKRDAPSGTALALGQAAAQARALVLEERAVHGRHGDTPRAEGDIGFHSLRGGDIVGEHQVWMVGTGERIQLTHVVTSRNTFAQGAAKAAQWVARKGPGMYTIDDVLGLTRA